MNREGVFCKFCDKQLANLSAVCDCDTARIAKLESQLATSQREVMDALEMLTEANARIAELEAVLRDVIALARLPTKDLPWAVLTVVVQAKKALANREVQP